MTTRRVVITGLGTINPLGLSVQDYWTNLAAGLLEIVILAGRGGRTRTSDFRGISSAPLTNWATPPGASYAD